MTDAWLRYIFYRHTEREIDEGYISYTAQNKLHNHDSRCNEMHLAARVSSRENAQSDAGRHAITNTRAECLPPLTNADAGGPRESSDACSLRSCRKSAGPSRRVLGDSPVALTTDKRRTRARPMCCPGEPTIQAASLKVGATGASRDAVQVWGSTQELLACMASRGKRYSVPLRNVNNLTRSCAAEAGLSGRNDRVPSCETRRNERSKTLIVKTPSVQMTPVYEE
ncbi:hypothetical protein MRX96_032216 [Rhipicephalus microplus]